MHSDARLLCLPEIMCRTCPLVRTFLETKKASTETLGSVHGFHDFKNTYRAGGTAQAVAASVATLRFDQPGTAQCMEDL
jgi:hypothetical protein